MRRKIAKWLAPDLVEPRIPLLARGILNSLHAQIRFVDDETGRVLGRLARL